MPRILIGGDICPTALDEHLFTTGNASALFGEVLEDFKAADLVIANLETPLVTSPSPIRKSGAVFGWPLSCLGAIQNAGIHLLNLGNNHIRDHGAKGIEETMRACSQKGIGYVGVGVDRDEALKPKLFSKRGIRIAVFSFAEEEFSIAAPNSPGASPLDPIDLVRIFREYRSRFDFAVVLLHAGKEHYPYPPPQLQKICRFIVEEGAAVVLCQHSHCPGAYERYRGGVIFYGQGNFIFNPHPDKRSWLYEGYLVGLDIENSEKFEWEIVPFVQRGARPGIIWLRDGEKQAFLDRIALLSAEIGNPDAMAKKWSEYCADKKDLYLGILRGHGPLMRRLDKRLKLATKLYSREELLVLLNVVRCQSHREMLLEILEREISR